MRLEDISLNTFGDKIRLSGVVTGQNSAVRIGSCFEYGPMHTTFEGAATDAFAAALLLVAMSAGEDLEIVPPVSRRLALQLPRLRDIFHTWWPQMACIDVKVAPRSDPSVRQPQSGATFYSGGVDSFYTLLKYRRGGSKLSMPLTHAVYMRGVEVEREKAEGVDRTEEWVRNVASADGVDLIVGETDIRTKLQDNHYLDYDRHYQGSALAAVALGLTGNLGFVCIPSAFSYNHLIAHGSTPLCDEMYSTDDLYILHDGSESSRPNKLMSILKWDQDLVLNHLRVCIWNKGGAYNCGKCYKCVRTAIPLYVLGLWDKAKTFPDKATDHWEEVVSTDYPALVMENIEFSIAHG